MTSVIKSRRQFVYYAAVALAGLVSTHGIAVAQETNWPTKPIRLVVGYAAGGATDVLARIIATKLSQQLGQSVVVDNRPGANSNVGAEAVARSTPDGYTLFVLSNANTANATLYAKPGFDVTKDLTPIGMYARIPNMLVVNPKVPVHTVVEYVKFANDSKNVFTIF